MSPVFASQILISKTFHEDRHTSFYTHAHTHTHNTINKSTCKNIGWMEICICIKYGLQIWNLTKLLIMGSILCLTWWKSLISKPQLEHITAYCKSKLHFIYNIYIYIYIAYIRWKGNELHVSKS
jgi:hypothetical protein